MADFNDLQLDRSAADEPPPPRSTPWLWLGLGLVALLAAGWYFVARDRAPETAAVTVENAPAPATPPARGPAEPGDDIPLPPLDESDALVRDLVARLSAHPTIAAWLTTDGLIRNFVVVVDNIANGQPPAVHLKAIPPQGKFQVRREGDRLLLDPASYSRYDRHAAAVDAIDARGAARLYATLRPRIDDAYRELGASRVDFDAALERAIVALLRTPVVEGEIPLRAEKVSYTYVDPRLESLTPAQRQFLRMGPRNMRIVKAKLREIAGYLGIPPESLPPPDAAAR